MLTRIRKRIKKVDGVVEAAHFDPDGRLAWVRAYERRGPTWSDLVLIDRKTLIQKLRKRERFYVGSRKEFLASEFDFGQAFRLGEGKSGPVVIVGRGQARQDSLEGVPVV